MVYKNRDDINKRFKHSLWAPVLRKQNGFIMDMNFYWDDYYLGTSLGYFNEGQIRRIEDLIKAAPAPSIDVINNFNNFFRNNVLRFIPIDHIILFINDLLNSKIKSYVFKNVKNAEILLDNLNWVKNVYFHWQYRRFPEPIDNYKWLSENRLFLVNLLTRNLSDISNDGLLKNILDGLYFDIDLMCASIYRVGLRHNFIYMGDNYNE